MEIGIRIGTGSGIKPTRANWAVVRRRMEASGGAQMLIHLEKLAADESLAVQSFRHISPPSHDSIVEPFI